MEMETKKLEKYGKIGKILLAITLVVALFGASYAIFRTTTRGEKTNEITTKDVGLIITNESENGILLENVVPIKEEEALKNNAYTFDLENTGDYLMNYRLGFELSDDTTMPAASVRYMFYKAERVESSILGTMTPEYVTDEENNTKVVYYLEAGQIPAHTTYNNYTLYMWIDYNASLEANGMKFKAKARVDGEAVTAGTAAWELNSKSALVTPNDDEIDAMYEITVPEGSEYAYKLNGSGSIIKYYIGSTSGTYLEVPVGSDVYVYAFTKNSFNIEMNQWYKTDTSKAVFNKYEGNNPLNNSDYTNIYSNEYYNKIVNSFN